MPTKGIGKANQKIELSDNQTNPSLATGEDFEPYEEALPFDGACGDSKAEYRRLTRSDRDKGKSKSVTPLDEYGRRLAG
jgi:hypothetical protein